MNVTPGEFDWIDRIARRLQSLGGEHIGDDAAVLGDGLQVWSIDALAEGVHFRFDWMSPRAVGYRALVASLSDLAAMAAEPVAALVALAAPADRVAEVLPGVYDGLAEAAGAFGCEVVGGDLTRAEIVHVVVTVLGECTAGAPLKRDAATPGDEVWVTGELGGPAAALALLGSGCDLDRVQSRPAYSRLVAPTPRLREMAFLSRLSPRAGIDISDGLSSDIGHIARASGVGARIDRGRVPVHPDAEQIGVELEIDGLEWALHGGEEFEVLFTAPPGSVEAEASTFERRFDLRLTRIGTIVPEPGVSLTDGDREWPLEPRGWDHFGPGCQAASGSVP